MTLFYEGSDGTVINLMGEGVYAQEPETLIKNEWKYRTNSGVNGVGRVKRFYKEDGHFRLQPENDAFEPIIVDEVILLGKVVSLVRNYE